MASHAAFRVLNDGKKVPAIAFGTGTALFGRHAKSEVAVALKAGITHIDCAEAYSNEESVGDALSEFFSSPNAPPRSSIYVTTKLGYTIPAGGSVRASLKKSLQKLKLDYVDLYLIHNPTNFVGHLKDIWRQMEEVKEEGLAISVGVSNFRLSDFAEFLDEAKIKPSVNQIEYHPYVLKAATPIVELQKKYGVALVSYGGLSPIVRRTDGPVSAVVASIRDQVTASSGKHITDGQVLSKWLQAKDAIIVTTSSKESRLTETLDIYDLPDLTPEQVKAIDEAGSHLHSRHYMNFMDQ